VAEHRDVIHKIGVTGGKVETRIKDGRITEYVYNPKAAKLVRVG